ncbi:Hypothetical_protein [Hexamita inflata]|uniref:Hypothetical_protein n=1 Tax=Hexamita inflata TaxID=28002 RepID=A0ABP1J039_9EUKA
MNLIILKNAQFSFLPTLILFPPLYQQALFTDRLSVTDKQVIIQFCKVNQSLNLIEITNKVLDQYFINRDIFYFDVYEFARQQYRIKTSQVKTRAVENQLTNMYTKIYKLALQDLFNKDYSDFSSQQICTTIQFLNDQQSKQFWTYIQNNVTPKNKGSEHKKYFNKSYKQVMHSYFITEEDKIFIKAYVRKSTEQNTSKITEYLMQTYFKLKDIFYYRVYRLVFQYQLKSSNIKLFYQNQQLDLKTVKQVCEQIDSLNKDKYRQFWNLLASRVEPKKTTTQLRIFYQKVYQQELYTYSLNDEDKEYISKYIQQNTHLSLMEMTEQLIQSYLKGKDVFYYDIYKNVRSIKLTLEKDKNIAPTQVLYHDKVQNEQVAYFTTIYKQGLKSLNILCDNCSPKEICVLINNLSYKPNNVNCDSDKFWKFVVKTVNPKQTREKLKTFFLRQYQKLLYSYKVTNDDRKYIREFCEQNRDMSLVDVTQKLLDTYFKEKDVFYRDVYIPVGIYLRKIKEKVRRQ